MQLCAAVVEGGAVALTSASAPPPHFSPSLPSFPNPLAQARPGGSALGAAEIDATAAASLAMRLLPPLAVESPSVPPAGLAGPALDDTVARALFVSPSAVFTDPSATLAAFRVTAAWRPVHAGEQLLHV